MVAMKIGAFAAALLLGPAPPAAEAGTYCRSAASATYCDDGTTFYQYGNRVESNRGQSWTRFGEHVYGSDGSWYAGHDDGVTSWHPGTADPLSARIVPDRLFGSSARVGPRTTESRPGARGAR